MSLRVVTALLDRDFEAAVVRRLGRADSGATVVRRCRDLVELRSVSAAGLADVAVVDLQLRGIDRDVMTELHSCGLRVVGTSDTVETFGDMGADATVPPDAERVCEALRGGVVVTRPAAPSDGLPGGRLIVVWGPIGAPGRTSLAVGIADELAKMDVPTLLADADCYGPSVAQHLGLLDDSSGLAAACRLAGQGRLDATAIARSAVALPSGLRVLTGIPRVDRWDELRPAALDMVWQQARDLVKFSVIDVGFCVEHDELAWFEPGLSARNQAAVATLAAADVIVAVTSADPVGLVRFLRAAPAVRALAPTARFDVVVNRVRSGRERVRDLRSLLCEQMNIERLALIPDEPQAFDACLRSGRTLSEVAARSDARKQIREIAAELGGIRLNRKRRRAA